MHCNACHSKHSHSKCMPRVKNATCTIIVKNVKNNSLELKFLFLIAVYFFLINYKLEINCYLKFLSRLQIYFTNNNMLIWNFFLAVMYFLSYAVFKKSNNFLLQWFFKLKKEKFLVFLFLSAFKLDSGLQAVKFSFNNLEHILFNKYFARCNKVKWIFLSIQNFFILALIDNELKIKNTQICLRTRRSL